MKGVGTPRQQPDCVPEPPLAEHQQQREPAQARAYQACPHPVVHVHGGQPTGADHQDGREPEEPSKVDLPGVANHEGMHPINAAVGNSTAEIEYGSANVSRAIHHVHVPNDIVSPTTRARKTPEAGRRRPRSRATERRGAGPRRPGPCGRELEQEAEPESRQDHETVGTPTTWQPRGPQPRYRSRREGQRMRGAHQGDEEPAHRIDDRQPAHSQPQRCNCVAGRVGHRRGRHNARSCRR